MNSSVLQLLKAQLNAIINLDNVDNNEVYEKEKAILELNKPNKWSVYADNNMEQNMEVEFEMFLINVAENVNESIDNISTFRFYSLVKYLKTK